jgi:hypothetical protein
MERSEMPGHRSRITALARLHPGYNTLASFSYSGLSRANT